MLIRVSPVQLSPMNPAASNARLLSQSKSSGTSQAWGCGSSRASRLRHRVQLTTDGHRPYLQAVEAAFGADIHSAISAGAPGGIGVTESGVARKQSLP
jgi:hypothetical protein